MPIAKKTEKHDDHHDGHAIAGILELNKDMNYKTSRFVGLFGVGAYPIWSGCGLSGVPRAIINILV